VLRLTAVLLLATIASANAPLPKVGDEKRTLPVIDIATITRIRLLRCKATEDPNTAICETEVKFAAITYKDGTQTVELPKQVIEVEPKPEEAHRTPR
jgi:hypothetical protein